MSQLELKKIEQEYNRQDFDFEQRKIYFKKNYYSIKGLVLKTLIPIFIFFMVAFWTIFWVKDVAKENLKNSIELLVQYGELTKNIQKAVGLNFAELARD